MVYVSARIVRGFQYGRTALLEVAALAFLLGTGLIIYKVGAIGVFVATHGYKALQTFDLSVVNGITLIIKVLFAVLVGLTSFFIDFAANSPILALIAALLFVVVLLMVVGLAEVALVFLLTYVSMSFYPVTITVNWNAFVGTYGAAQYPLGPVPYLVIPPAILTVYAYQLANYELSADSAWQTLLNGLALVVGYETVAVAALILFVGVPQGLALAAPGWEWFIQFDRTLETVLLLTLLVYPVGFSLLGGILAVLAPEALPDYEIGEEAGSLVLRLIAHAVFRF